MDNADDLLQRALIDAQASVSVALKVADLPISDALTVIFHGRRDLGTLQTYITHGGRAAGAAVGASELLRVPCDLDLADASSRDEAEELYATQARALRDAIVASDTVLSLWAGELAAMTGSDVAINRSIDLDLGDAGDRLEAEELYAAQARALKDAIKAADTVLAVWREPLEDIAESSVTLDRSVQLRVDLPAHRLIPVALFAPDRQVVVAPVCGARTLAEGLPPMGIACAVQDVAHVYPLADDPEACLVDFLQRAAEHARRTAERLEHQEASVERFLELSGGDGDE